MNLNTFRPPYLIRRIRQMCFEKKHPGTPWLTESAVLLLDSYLKDTDVGLEWGSGRSTLWFAAKVKHLTSVEHDPEWHGRVADMLKNSPYAEKVDYRFVACEQEECEEPVSHAYADVAASLDNESLDFALVDGTIRINCMESVLDKIKPGGLLILDNANRFIPNRFGAGFATIHEPRETPRGPRWERMIAQLRPWRWIHTSDGIWDTRFWLKPGR